MASIRFTKYTLVVLLLLHIRDSSAQTQQGTSMKDLANSELEFHDGGSAQAEIENKWVGVRKMMFTEDEKRIFKANSLNSPVLQENCMISSANIPSISPPVSSTGSKKNVPQESHKPFEDLESLKPLKAANHEMVNLMSKDYNLPPGPRRKPPINN